MEFYLFARIREPGGSDLSHERARKGPTLMLQDLCLSFSQFSQIEGSLRRQQSAGATASSHFDSDMAISDCRRTAKSSGVSLQLAGARIERLLAARTDLTSSRACAIIPITRVDELVDSLFAIPIC